tara:strand:+ start:677 stop:799 length:123 start_codon:yes stop_codon:yes gene_type:complete
MFCRAHHPALIMQKKPRRVFLAVEERADFLEKIKFIMQKR